LRARALRFPDGARRIYDRIFKQKKEEEKGEREKEKKILFSASAGA